MVKCKLKEYAEKMEQGNFCADCPVCDCGNEKERQYYLAALKGYYQKQQINPK